MGDAAEPVPAIEVDGVAKAFGGMNAVSSVSLRLERGDIAALLGPSGSGKTTLLRMIAGFERPDAGQIRVGGRLVAGSGGWVEPEQRRIGMVFQQGALFPHLTVEANVGFGATRPARVGECLELVELAKRGSAYPHELSGGERQRVALARALAADPEVVLLDEPFAALDATLRESLREQVAGILRAAGASALLVTHDQAEALSLADVVAVMRDGRLEQSGSPEAVYERPRTRWVAEFLGEANVLAGTAGNGSARCELGSFAVAADLSGPVDLVVRPESVAVSHGGRRGADADGVVVARSFYGHGQVVTVELASGLRLRSRGLGFPAWHPGDRVSLSVAGPVSALAAPREAAPVAHRAPPVATAR